MRQSLFLLSTILAFSLISSCTLRNNDDGDVYEYKLDEINKPLEYFYNDLFIIKELKGRTLNSQSKILLLQLQTLKKITFTIDSNELRVTFIEVDMGTFYVSFSDSTKISFKFGRC